MQAACFTHHLSLLSLQPVLLPTTIASASAPAAGCVQGTDASWLLNVPSYIGTKPETKAELVVLVFFPLLLKAC